MILVFWALKGGALPAANAEISTFFWDGGPTGSLRQYAATHWDVDGSDGRSMKPMGGRHLRGKVKASLSLIRPVLRENKEPFRSTEKRREDKPQRGKGQRSRGGSHFLDNLVAGKHLVNISGMSSV